MNEIINNKERDIMGRVMMILDVLPEGIEVNLDDVKAQINDRLKGKADIKKAEIVPFAFGLKKISLSVIVNDASGGSETVEEAIKEIPGVQGVETLDMSLI
ncbi:MAG: elongation factor 1-beta [Thermoplasmata archaeon]